MLGLQKITVSLRVLVSEPLSSVEALDQLGKCGEEKYILVLEFFKIPLDPESNGYKLGSGVGCWLSPIPFGQKGSQHLAKTKAFQKGQKAVRYNPTELTKKMCKLYEEAGLHVSEPELAKAMGQALEKELVSIEGATFKDLAKEFELQAAQQMEKKAIPKTAPSVKKALESTSGVGSKEIQRLEKEISSWLGEETQFIRNKAGDPIFISKDGTRKVRFDFNRPHHHESPHLHFEKLEEGYWGEIKRIYPSDLPHK